jgi:hypothetical protein
VSLIGEKRNAYRILVRKPEGKRPLGRPRHRWVYNIKMDLQEIGWDGMEWIGLIRLLNPTMNLCTIHLNIIPAYNCPPSISSSLTSSPY